MTHHSGLIRPFDGWICTRIEECRHIDLTIIQTKNYKTEVVNKDNVKKIATRKIICYGKKEFLP